ncbi:sialate O-acetylesterase [Flammeovirgaceae bacterium SG7u.132]|nr:sialate O-acetylesterase [Flammeovirgaceae bacterium SG7u.132]
MNRTTRKAYAWKYLIWIVAICAATSLEAAVILPDIICNNMVLQRDQPVPIWGTANPGEKITVNFAGQTLQATASEDRKWIVRLKPMPVNASPQTMVIKGDNTIELEGIVIGEVWLLTGQSNMQLILEKTNDGEAVIASADKPNIRLFNVNRKVAFHHKRGQLATWETCNPESIREFSAVGYYFGVELQEALDIPIGLINASYGGSQVEAWMPEEYLLASDDFRPCVERTELWAAARPVVQAQYDKDIAEWKKAAEEAKANGTKAPRQPRVPDALRDYRIASSIYNNMIEPLIPYSIRGAYWYQGESNEERAEQYGLLMPVFVQSWREKWEQGDFPFGIVQLPNYRDIEEEPTDNAWAHLREAHRLTVVNGKNMGLIVTIDIGEAHDIHPHNKLDVGKRMATWALAKVYGKELLPSGPMFKEQKVMGDKIILQFDGVGERLKTKDGEELAEFAIAGADKNWYWAKAKIISKDKVEVWSEQVPKPIAVRYAFNSNPKNPNLTNESGLPASPFRTDAFYGPTAGKR